MEGVGLGGWFGMVLLVWHAGIDRAWREGRECSPVRIVAGVSSIGRCMSRGMGVAGSDEVVPNNFLELWVAHSLQTDVHVA